MPRNPYGPYPPLPDELKKLKELKAYAAEECHGLVSPATTAEQKKIEQACERANALVKTQELRMGTSPIDPSIEARTRRCETAYSNINPAATEAKRACTSGGLGTNYTSCFGKVKRCEESEDGVVSVEADNNEFSQNRCNALLANACPQLPQFNTGRNYKEEEKEAETSRKESKRIIDELLDDQQKARAELRSKELEYYEQTQEQQNRFKKSLDDISEGVAAGLKGISNEQKKQFNDARAAFMQMDAEYSKMRAAAREKADDVVAAKENLELVCRAVAEKKFKEADAARLAAKKVGKRNQGSATRMAGDQTRNAKNDIRKRNADYLAFYNECKAGLAPEGVEATNRVTSAERGRIRFDAQLADQSTLMEAQRKQIRESLVELSASLDGDKKTLVEQSTKRMTALNESFTQATNTNQNRMAELQRAQQERDYRIQVRLNTAQGEMNKYENEALIAKRRTMCMGTAGQRSESRQEKIQEGRNEVVGALSALQSACKYADIACRDLSVAGSAKMELPGICYDGDGNAPGGKNIRDFNRSYKPEDFEITK